MYTEMPSDSQAAQHGRDEEHLLDALRPAGQAGVSRASRHAGTRRPRRHARLIAERRRRHPLERARSPQELRLLTPLEARVDPRAEHQNDHRSSAYSRSRVRAAATARRQALVRPRRSAQVVRRDSQSARGEAKARLIIIRHHAALARDHARTLCVLRRRASAEQRIMPTTCGIWPYIFLGNRIDATCRRGRSRMDQIARKPESGRAGRARGGAAGAAAHMAGRIFHRSGRPAGRRRRKKVAPGCPSIEPTGEHAYRPRASPQSSDPTVLIRRLVAGDVLRRALPDGRSDWT